MCLCVRVCVLHKAKVGREVANLFAFDCDPLPHNNFLPPPTYYCMCLCTCMCVCDHYSHI